MTNSYAACFEYPVDSKTLLRKKGRIKRSLLASSEPFIEKRIAVLGGSTTNEIVDQLELFLLNYGIKPTFYQSEYAQYWQDAMFGSEGLDDFNPDIVYVHTNWRNVTHFPTTASTKEAADALLEAELAHFTTMWDKLADRFACPIIQDSFDRPAWRLLGNSDVSDYRGRSNFLSRLNQGMYEYAQAHPSFFVNDVEYLQASYGMDEWSNPLFWHMYKYSLCLDAIPTLAQSVAALIKSIYGKNKKVVVCDLDNTLWGGVVGDDGVEGIQVGPEVPMGQVYAEFQSYLKELKSIGVILAVNSKNDEENALAGLAHPDGPLGVEDFASIKANWNNKDQNMRALAAELNLGADSFVFADDNPAERQIVREANLGIAIPELGGVETYVRMIDRNNYFEVTSLSSDDLERAEMYRRNAQRVRLEESTDNYDDFLTSLEMHARIHEFEPIYVQRIAQLTNKSNQFNLTTLRCSTDDIEAMAASPSHLCLYGKLQDKFGDNGVVSVVVGEQDADVLHMRLWLMSCRVLKRGMEDAMLDALVGDAGARGVSKVMGYYYPTPKNGMVRDFYDRMGFTKLTEEEDGSTTWELDVADYQTRNTVIAVER